MRRPREDGQRWREQLSKKREMSAGSGSARPGGESWDIHALHSSSGVTFTKHLRLEEEEEEESGAEREKSE